MRRILAAGEFGLVAGVTAQHGGRGGNWQFKATRTNNHVNIDELENLPVPRTLEAHQDQLIKWATKITAAKEANPAADTSAWKNEIDRLVYELYGLTPYEVNIIERVL